MRRRNISWDDQTDALAERLAGERGYTQAKGGVSKFLEDLVTAAASGKGVASFKAPLAEIEKRLTALEKKNRK